MIKDMIKSNTFNMPIDKNKRASITFTVNKHVKKNLIILANKNNRSLSNFLAWEVEKILENNNFPPGGSAESLENT